MKPAKNVMVHDDPQSTWWFDEDGILYSIGKKNPPKPTKEESEEQLKKFKELFGDKKICMILEISNAKPPKKEERDEAAVVLNEMVKAMAMVTTSPLSRMIANLFFGLKPPAYPVKIFSNADEARKWIRQYL